MKKSVYIIIFLFGIIISLSLVKAIVHNRLSTSGVHVSKVEEETIFYKTQNAILSEKLLAESSLTNVLIKADKLGFVKNNSVMVLKSSRPLAIKQ